MDFTRVVQIFEKGELYFARPSTWDDPYEQRIKHAQDHAIFAQCWGRSPISDAMWRIYSQHGAGVRISTTLNKLTDVMKATCKERNYLRRIKQVEYFSQKEIDEITKKIAQDLRESFDIGRAVDVLYMKREAFSHEAEWRAMFFTKKESREKEEKGISIKIDPHKFIDRILLDPRAPDELVRAFEFYFKEKLGFKGNVQRSSLYKIPEPYIIENNSNDTGDL
ncbi:DUF2971 domain-containing protein [Pseudomonas syringae pv. syringae]|nr:DUF2971 domain-containing protein [Pseudomonas syringae]MCH5542227.1 DUF2971 domain-containing protein [Pseudomonas syringae pv. syringae]MCH5547550.1 DUF2971 domain-containing protein [Pseudomonas syringae pv. syringae]MCH5650666.1 DUF2971 domain-containing protein [Pseudomonas syringae pv. syringae]